jgi:hypothetical protein
MWSSDDEFIDQSDDEDQVDADDPAGDQQYSISSHSYQALKPEKYSIDSR